MHRCAIVALPILLLIAVAPPATAQNSHTETFTNTTYKDNSNTTADWNTVAGQLRLFTLPQLAGTYNTPGTSQGVVIDGFHAFVADGASGLYVIDISDPTTPTLAGNYNTSGNANSVTVQGDLAFVADGTSGLQVIVINDPTTPTLAGTYNTSGDANCVVVEGHLAFVADGISGLQVVDVSDSTAPTLTGTYNTPGNANSVVVAGDLAFVADGASGLVVIDISDPTTPTLAGTYNTSGDAISVVVAGDLAFVADGAPGLVVIDISDPTTPTLTGAYDTPGLAQGLAVTGNRAFVADDASGLVMIDISIPTNPTLAATYDTPGLAQGLAVVGDLAFVADNASGLQVITIRYPTTPTLAGTYDTPGYASDIAVAGDLAYFADNHTGLSVVDISDPTAPSLIGTYDTPGLAQGIYVAGDLAFVADGDSGLQVIDISDPTTPTFVGRYDTPGNARDIAVSGDLAVVADLTSGLQIIDISDPTTPALTGSYVTAGSAFGVAVTGDLAFVAASGSGMQVIDISNPATPALVDTWDTPGTALKVASAGDLAFVAGATSGIQIVDISDPTNLVYGGAYNTPGSAYNLDIVGRLAFVADNAGGLQVINITNPLAPTLVGSYDTPGAAYSVAVEGNLAFIADYVSGLQVIRVFQHEVVPGDNVGQSLAVDGASDTIVRARLTSTETSGIFWELSPNGGTNWQAFAADNVWNRFTTIGDELQWRSTHTWSLGVNPAVSDLTIDWRNEFGFMASIADVPDDQGGRVYVALTRSGYDFADETTNPVTQYGIYRRVDSVALIASVELRFGSDTDKEENGGADLSGIETALIDGTRYVLGSAAAGAFPPGTWALVKTVPATQSDAYLAEVTTDADSSAAGSNYSVYLVTTHTTTPSVWFVSHIDSGYSVDNIAPRVPQNLAAAYNTGSGNMLSWDAAPEPDFQHYRIYRDSDPNFVPSVANFVAGTIATDWTDPDNDGGPVYYKVSAVDHAGNESDPSVTGSTSSIDNPALPTRFALHDAMPNPFNPTTTIRFDIGASTYVSLRIYDVSGRLVRTLIERNMTQSHQSVVWDGMTDAGDGVSSGVYLYRLRAGNFSETKKMVLLK